MSGSANNDATVGPDPERPGQAVRPEENEPEGLEAERQAPRSGIEFRRLDATSLASLDPGRRLARQRAGAW